MKRALLVLFIGLALILAQGILRILPLASALVPNLMLPLVVYLAFYLPTPAGAMSAFLIGLEYDIFASRSLLGPYAGAYVVVFALVASFSQRLFLESLVTVCLTVFVSVLISYAVYVILVSQFMPVGSLIAEMGRYLFVEGLVTACVTPFLFQLFNWTIRLDTKAVPAERARRSASGRYQRVM